MARVTGHPDDAVNFETRRKVLISAINGHLWNGSTYRTPGYGGATDDRGSALMVVAGVADATKWPAMKAVLGAEFHASPYMEKYVLEALCQMGDTDAAVARMRKRYDAFVASPLTTLPENWNGGRLGQSWLVRRAAHHSLAVCRRNRASLAWLDKLRDQSAAWNDTASYPCGGR